MHAYAQSLDPTFSPHVLANHVLLAGSARKKILCYFVPDRCLVVPDQKESDLDTIDEKYTGSALATMMFLGYHFHSPETKLMLSDNFCKEKSLKNSTDKNVQEMCEVAWIINPEDNDSSSKMLMVLMFPTDRLPLDEDN
jgi:hypothetical protein